MAKSKDLEELDRERTGSGLSPGNRGEADEPAIGSPKPEEHPGSYERCMQAYRWLSRRYRKTLDALAK